MTASGALARPRRGTQCADDDIMNPHPYSTLPSDRFWRNAVEGAEGRCLERLWQPKFPITRDAGIVTAGSCFAQHISRHLVRAGFRWLEGEPAPQELTVEERGQQGYGLFSFRTGNIYTPALLWQWIAMALGGASISDEMVVDEGRYHDPLRPSVSPRGFTSHSHALAARKLTLEAIRQVLERGCVFIFTLGLTEHWRNTDGCVYPMCPGTVRGTFDADRHRFHNSSHEEIVTELQQAFAAIRAVNPRMKFLLTVSPVPLTATATADHVLTAAMHSKSVLRAAAGFLAHDDADVDYFPSYELIASPVFRGRYFNGNLRTVSPAGVRHVMRHFTAAIGAAGETFCPEPVAAGVAPPGSERAAEPFCEDVILEQWSHRIGGDSVREPDLVLVGDSHMSLLAEQLRALGVGHAGGGMMDGSQWHWLSFVPDPKFFLIPTDAAVRERWMTVLRTAGMMARPDFLGPRGQKTILTNIGAHTHMVPSDFVLYLSNKYGRVPQPIDGADVRSYLIAGRGLHLQVIRGFVDAGHRVVWISDPPAQSTDSALYTLVDTILCELVAAVGAKPLNARLWIAEHGGWSDRFCSASTDPQGKRDVIHGNPFYYGQLCAEIAELRANAFTVGGRPG
jgi:hypothetical protein